MTEPATSIDDGTVATPTRQGMTRRQTKATIRIAQYLILLAVIVLIGVLGDWSQFRSEFLDVHSAAKTFSRMLSVGLVNTLLFTVVGFAVALVVGIIVALMKISSFWLYRWLANVYIEIFRGLPTLVVLFLVTFGLPVIFPNSGVLKNFYVQVAIGLGCTAGAYVAETIRGGIQAVPRGQMEAARSLGMSTGRAMRTIVLPQAFRIIIPPMTNQLIYLVKDSSLVYALGVTAQQYELTKLSQLYATGGVTGVNAGATPLILGGLFYLVITLPLSQLVNALERRQSKRRF